MLAMIPSLRDDVADSVFRRLALDPDPGRFADWAVALAECCVTEDIGADAAVELLGAMGGPEAWAALERLSVKPDGPAAWENAEAAQGELRNLENQGRRGPNPPPPARQPPPEPLPAPPTHP